MAPTSPSELAPALADLDRRFAIATTNVALAGGAVTLEHPRNADDLISEADFVRDERLPYWADVWPSSVALAGIVAALTGRGRALELGCGLGLVTIAAMRAGFDVLATDYYEDALLFTRRNAVRATGRDTPVRHLDWREPMPELGRFDLVLASDVLYERAYAGFVAAAIAGTLAPGGRALVADPGRIAVEEFRASCASRGCTVQVVSTVPWSEGTVRQSISIHEVRPAP